MINLADDSPTFQQKCDHFRLVFIIDYRLPICLLSTKTVGRKQQQKIPPSKMEGSEIATEKDLPTERERNSLGDEKTRTEHQN